ncbi:MAG: hypothetical protein A2128_01445 [Candidatus Liptonbacteria bacterium GWC1_60_9]|uniref:Uncharacterized protein n=3 Tax=Candidatus Liptoniibacteriota TaxID=1817909 RepID=A0A1G2CPY3_9BACT|nr:MAG: hypothetical protein A2128_01445 [Candidatus Liptonbacteria bacterium GWC1_60_9]OGZ00168.1 MAG: hypothetical protein A3E09_01580 [Candidatus Liptonbacteria bacterium RIFCSPHIGHO2_12_FULL_60_13]OGZ02691.1 MAG: hypothetical protein A3G64_02795 [Candidatus Liptonbacteria bacterium RIFCSPLOWO2_12_FULL_60_15]
MIGLILAATLTAQLTDVRNIPSAENVLNIIPQPLYELFDAAKNINIGAGGDNAVTRTILEFLPASRDDIGQDIGTAADFLDRANSWFEGNVGIRFTQLFRLVGNLAIWILQGLAELLRIGISYVGE